MMALGAANDVAATYSVSRSIAREMRSLGIGWNFAPVADINTNPDNPIINIRSFGEQAELVADHVHA
jgi:beta-N-acetylhexosaminidase